MDDATVSTLSLKTPPLAKGHTYYPYVSACNISAQCTKSAVWTFKIQ